MPDQKLQDRSFIWFNATQFLGALNDNMFKLFVIFFLIGILGAGQTNRIVATGSAFFVLPFLLFSAAAGVLADKYSKKTIIVICKFAELAVMICGAAAFLLKSELGLYIVLFLMATHSAVFSPSKYGIVPELVERDELSKSNSLLVMFTYIAIVVGTALAPFVAQQAGSNYVLAQAACVIFAAAGVAAAFMIKNTPPADPGKKMTVFFVSDIWRTLVSIKGDKYLLQAVLSSAYFTMLGAYLQLNMIPYGIAYLGLGQEQSGYLFFVAAVGIGAGARVAGKLSGRDIEFGIVPLGAFLLTLASVSLNFLPANVWVVCPAIFLAGMGAGLFIVPVDSFVQYRAPLAERGQILAASNFLGWVGVLIASGLVYLNTVMGFTAGQGFVMMGLLTLALTIVSFLVLPDFLLRFITLVITRLVYDIKVKDAENVPLEGPALLVCNHISYVDALLLVATQQRRLRFVMTSDIYEGWAFFTPLFKIMGCIPINMKDPPKKIIASLQAARQAMDDGFLVCIFAEGALTRTGMLREFRKGFTKIVKNTNYPIIPVYIGGAWGTFTSYYHGKFVKKLAGTFRYPVSVLFGRPLPAASSAGEVRLAVMELSCDYFNGRKEERGSLGRNFVETARGNWRRQIMSDTTGKKLTYGRALAASLLIRSAIKERTREQDKVGILLPASAGGALANIAVTLSGKVPVNLNYTVSKEAFASAIAQCSIRTIITSRAFMEKMSALSLPENSAVYLEDLTGDLSAWGKLLLGLKAKFAPAGALLGEKGFTPDQTATVIFSSGSTGAPKGVELSHHNILSNIESLRIVFDLADSDNICSALPLFHSLGYTASLWYPLLSGVPVSYHMNPLEAAAVAGLARENKSTMLFATPTLLMLYMHRAKKEDFAALRYVIVGAEKMKPKLADLFEKKFGVRPLEGYGATELAPVAALSVPHADRDPAEFQAGWKEGSVGLPLPGVAMKVVDMDTGAFLPAGQEGLLLVKGPNVMTGYLGQPGLTAEALKDGWYKTGDVARIDEDGFVCITDRLSRFSKIGGEMVPHLAVEEALQRGLGKVEPVVAVTGVPDERKGERLVVLHTPEAGEAAAMHALLAASALPNLWKPSADSYFRIDSFPVLGTGKLDLKALKQKALELSGPGAAGQP